MKNNNTFNIILNIVLDFIIVVAIILIIALGGVRLIGFTPYAVTSGSMIPEYNVGSVVYVKDISPDELQVDDDISFYLGEDRQTIATHRIREINKEERYVQTYGINNKDSQGNQINDAAPVDFDYIIGKVYFSIPKLGYIYLYALNQNGKKVLIGLLALVIVLQLVFNLKRRKNNEREHKK